MTVTADDAKTPSEIWAKALSTKRDPEISKLAMLIFGLSPSREKLENDLADDRVGVLYDRKDTCLTLLTSSLTRNDLRSLGDLRFKHRWCGHR